MMIYINGELCNLDGSIVSVQDLLTFLAQPTDYIAIAVNLEILPKDKYKIKYLTELDEVEILTPMQGG